MYFFMFFLFFLELFIFLEIFEFSLNFSKWPVSFVFFVFLRISLFFFVFLWISLFFLFLLVSGPPRGAPKSKKSQETQRNPCIFTVWDYIPIWLTPYKVNWSYTKSYGLRLHVGQVWEPETLLKPDFLNSFLFVYIYIYIYQLTLYGVSHIGV